MVGKTELAKSLAAIGGRKLVRLQCYEGLDDNRALYEWDYAKQTPARADAPRPDQRSGFRIRQRPPKRPSFWPIRISVCTPRTSCPVRPLLEAILSPDPVVLLVDEVDRTEESMEALLLEILAEQQITIPEVGTFVARSQPWVILTSNDTRELSPALKRRCLHYHLGYPTSEREREIVTARAPEVDSATATEVVELARILRDLPPAQESVHLGGHRRGQSGNSARGRRIRHRFRRQGARTSCSRRCSSTRPM